MEKGKNPWPCVIMFQYKTSSAEKNKWVFPPCVGWNYHCVWLITVSVSMAPQPNCSFNSWDKRQEYISTRPPSSPLSYTPGAEPEQHLLGQNPWDSLQAQRSGYAGKPLHPAAPCKFLQRLALTGMCMGAAMNRMSPTFSFKINIGSKLGFLP